jgi:hypothetical protein
MLASLLLALGFSSALAQSGPLQLEGPASLQNEHCAMLTPTASGETGQLKVAELRRCGSLKRHRDSSHPTVEQNL